MSAPKTWKADRALTLRGAILLFAALLVACCPLHAQEQRLSQMLHKAWLGRDGAPQDINALVQTRDGLLWIGSSGGLFSFDGIAFRPFRPKPGDAALPFTAISSLVVSKNGDLWVEGIYNASVARISNGRVSVFDRFVGAACCYLADLQEDADGVMWAMHDAYELVQLSSDNLWHPSPTPNGRGGVISCFFFDSLGTQWVIQDKRLYKRLRGQTQFIATNGLAGVNVRLEEDREHRLWVLGRHHNADREMRGANNIAMVAGSGRRTFPTSLIGLQINDLMEMPDSTFWLAIQGKGVARLKLTASDSANSEAIGPTMEFYTAEQGLSSNNPTVFYRDTSGNTWIAGARGLDRFSPAHLVPVIGDAAEGAWSVCTNPAGEVWLASDKGDVSVLQGDRRRLVYRAQSVYKLYCGRAGDIWFIDRVGIMHAYKGHFDRLPPLPESARDLGGYSKFVALSELKDHEVVASEELSSHDSVWVFRDRKWTRLLPNGGPGTVTTIVNQSGTLFFGDISGQVTEFTNNAVIRFTTQPTSIGVIANLSTTSDGMFALGDRGIAVSRKTYFQMLSFRQPELAYTVSGLVEATNGDYWINGSHGIVHIDSKEMTAALKEPSHKIAAEEVHEGNFVGPATWWKPNPSATVDIRGILWFSTLNGVVSLNPENLNRFSNQPQLSIRSITADGHDLSPSRIMSAQSHALNIQYFGINLSEPEDVIYRYRLDGLEHSWQNVGHRIEAIYTNLRPGVYTFRVMASNGDGRWTDPVSSPPITIAPHYYQTWWFDVICALGLMFLSWYLLTIRVRAVAESVRIRADERGDERIRIAGELHDTLLQGVQGLLLSFHVLAQRLTTDDELKPKLERALAMAEQITVEGRNRVNGLRSQNLSEGELLESLERICADLIVGVKARCTVVQTGVPATLRQHVVDEIFNIGREALTNAVRHSEASTIELRLDYAKSSFTISCRDNGCGFDAAASREHPRPNHWGLRGIAERAARVGGTFTCESAPTKGTTITVSIPRSRAYMRPPGIFSSISLPK